MAVARIRCAALSVPPFTSCWRTANGSKPWAVSIAVRQSLLPTTTTTVPTAFTSPTSANLCFDSTGLSRDDVSAQSLRAGGAMALLCGQVDKDDIMLLSRWHSDAMMQYLHQDCRPVMQKMAQKMYNNGAYSFLPTRTTVPFL